MQVREHVRIAGNREPWLYKIFSNKGLIVFCFLRYAIDEIIGCVASQFTLIRTANLGPFLFIDNFEYIHIPVVLKRPHNAGLDIVNGIAVFIIRTEFGTALTFAILTKKQEVNSVKNGSLASTVGAVNIGVVFTEYDRQLLLVLEVLHF